MKTDLDRAAVWIQVFAALGIGLCAMTLGLIIAAVLWFVTHR